MCQEKKKEDDLPAFKKALMQRYDDSVTTYSSAEEDLLELSKTIQTTQSSTKQK